MTAEDLYAMQDADRKDELQGGVLVSEPLPGSRHGRLVSTIDLLLATHVRAHRLGVVFAGDAGFLLARSPDTLRGPDVAFVSRERFDAVGDVVHAFPGAPDLAIEVLSPSNTPASVHAKVGDYLAAGTRLVWVVDVERRVVTAYTSLLSPRILGERELLDGGDVVPGFRVPIADLFEI